MKRTLLIVSAVCLCIVVLCLGYWQHRHLNKSAEGKSTFLVLSTGDSNGVETIIGVRTAQAIDSNSDLIVYPIESLDNREYFSLKYPFQSGDKVYYTTTDAGTGEECIIVKTAAEPEWHTAAVSEYYRKDINWEVLLKKEGRITHKKAVGDMLYYLTGPERADADGKSEIWRYDMNAQKEELLITDVHPDSSFDVAENGDILYVNAFSSVVLRDADGTEQELGSGTAACFYNESDILFADSSGVSILSLTNGKKQKLCSASGNVIILSPSRTYIALCNEGDYKNLEYQYINVVDIASGRTNAIKNIPNSIYGVAWFDDYYPIS